MRIVSDSRLAACLWEVVPMSWWHLLRKVECLLFVLNPAACWLLIREGKQVAYAYLHHLWTFYLWRQVWQRDLPLRATAPFLVPEVSVDEVFPGIDLSRVERLYSMPTPGGVYIEELAILCGIVALLKPKRIVEIGTTEGRTTLNLALYSPPDAEIITLDLPPDAPPVAPESGPDYRQAGIAEPGVLFRNHPLAAKIHLVLADSTSFNWSPYERSVDLVFIDGAHDYESVRKDSENALRIVRPGGVILWHDYANLAFPGVTMCLNELRRRLPIFWLSGTRLAVLKVDALSP